MGCGNPGNRCKALSRKGLSPLHPSLYSPKQLVFIRPAVSLWCDINSGVVDPLSLAMSLRGNMDERVEEAIEDLMDAFWEGTIWSEE